MNLSLHWYDAAGGTVLRDGPRTALGAAVEPTASRTVTATVTAPPVPGSYLLRCALVKEGVAWFPPSNPLPINALAGFVATVMPPNAQRAAFRTGTAPGLDIYGDGRGCNTVTGRFTVYAIQFSPVRLSTSMPPTNTIAKEGRLHSGAQSSSASVIDPGMAAPSSAGGGLAVTFPS